MSLPVVWWDTNAKYIHKENIICAINNASYKLNNHDTFFFSQAS